MASSLSFLQILVVSIGAISQVSLTCLMGFLAGLFPRGDPLLTRSFVKRLATLSMLLFEPCLIFYVFTSRLNRSVIMVFWVVPVWQLLSSATNYSYGKFFTYIASQCGCLRNPNNTDETLLRVIPILCTFQNPVAFLLPVFASLCESAASGTAPYENMTGADAQLACTTDTTLFSFLCMIPWSLLFWLWGYPKLAALSGGAHQALIDAPEDILPSTPASHTNAPSEKATDATKAWPEQSCVEDSVDTPNEAAEAAEATGSGRLASVVPSSIPDPEVIGAVGVTGLRQRLPSNASPERRPAASPDQIEQTASGLDFPQEWSDWVDSQSSPWAAGTQVDWSLFSAMPSSSGLDDSVSVASSRTGFSLDVESMGASMETAPICSRCRGRCKRCFRKLFINFCGLLRILAQPSLLATLVGIAAGLVGFPRTLLFEQTSSPLRPVGRTIQTLGQPAPLMGVLILSASLAGSLRDRRVAEAEKRDSVEPDTSAGLIITLIPLFVRSILSPATGLGLVYGLTLLHHNEGLLGRIASIALPPGLPWLHLTIVLQWSSAPAQTIVVACARLGLDNVAGALSRMYLPLYLMAIVAVTASSSLALSLLF